MSFLPLIALLGALALLSGGCSSGTKSGGTAKHEITLVMQTPDAPSSDAEYFIAQVKARTHGRVQVVEGTDYSSADPNNEARLVRALRSGKEKIAYIPSRAWERASSDHSFRALQAPFLVTDYGRVQSIAAGQIGRAMLASLGRIGVVGLGLVPDELRRLLGRRPLDSQAALRGARIRVVTSPTSVLVLRALGAVPLTSFTSAQTGVALRSGRLDGAELGTTPILDNGYVSDARYLTANVALFAKTQTIAIERSVFDRLGRADQAALRAAAAATVAHADPAARERNEIRELCSQGLRLVRARPADIASLHRAAAPVYGVLERDPATRAQIQAIARLPQQASASSSVPNCPSNRPRQSGSPATALAGTYVLTASQAEVASAPGSHEVTDNWGSFRLVLGDGRFRLSDQRRAGALVPGAHGGAFSNGWTVGTYAIRGDRITFTQEGGSGDTPLGTQGDQPVVCRWSLYRGALTFRPLGTKGGPPALYVKPWRQGRRASAPAAIAFPVGTFETKITSADVRRVVGPTWWAHWETLTFAKNGTFRDVWFHPRRRDQPVTRGRYTVHGDQLQMGPRKDTFQWSYYRGLLKLRIVRAADLDALGFLIFETHAWRKIS